MGDARRGQFSRQIRILFARARIDAQIAQRRERRRTTRREAFLRRDPLANPEPLIQRVYAYCAYRLGQGPDAEDAAADVFERAVRHRASYDPRKGTPAAWLVGIARRTVDDVAAGRLPTVDELPQEAAPERDIALRVDLARMVERLDRHDRELIALRYGADLTARQIGEHLGMSAHAVEMALHRALGRLRGELERGGPEYSPRALRPGTAP
jgi:RNA polymerase sigma-70 factor, ECF subfamily